MYQFKAFWPNENEQRTLSIARSPNSETVLPAVTEPKLL